MDAGELVELAALVATHVPALISEVPRLSNAALQQYWTESKCRLDRWGREFRSYQRVADQLEPGWIHERWHTTRATMQEVLASEVLTRVWSAAVIAHDLGKHHQIGFQ